MTYEKKNGEFACFKKQSQKGTNYFNGTLLLDGKEYWISIFNSHSQKGEQYLSGTVKPKEEKKEIVFSPDDFVDPKEREIPMPKKDAGWDYKPVDAYDPVKNEFTDNIPF